MPKILLSFLIGLITLCQAQAQMITSTDVRLLRLKEDSLKKYALQIIQGRTSAERFIADSQFTRMFVRALKVKNSIHYPFDSLITISKLSPSDSTFKIFTWQMVINDNVVRQHGAIQMKTSDGSLKLFPLIDKSEQIVNPGDTIASNMDWFGAVYYRLIETQAFGRKYYTLLGYDENTASSTKKVIEVLSFYDKEPKFGGSYFSFKNNSLQQHFGKRYIMEFKKSASPRLTYDTEQDMIVFEHLVSETGEVNKKYTYIPDGDYEGLKWKDGKWVYVEKVFDYKTSEGQEPVPHPIRDAKGNMNEELLKDNTPAGSESVATPDVPVKQSTKANPGKKSAQKK